MGTDSLQSDCQFISESPPGLKTAPPHLLAWVTLLITVNRAQGSVG